MDQNQDILNSVLALSFFFKKNNILLMHKQYMCDVKKFKYREAHMKKLKYHIPTT